MIIGPASNVFLDILKIDTPVSLSPLIKACCIGQAPQYLGSIEGWKTNIPSGNLSIIFEGIIKPKDATKPISYWKSGDSSSFFQNSQC